MGILLTKGGMMDGTDSATARHEDEAKRNTNGTADVIDRKGFAETYTVEECCEILDSQRVPIKGSERSAGEYPYYGANGIQDYVDDYIFDDELVLLAEDGGNFGSKTRPIAYRVSGKCWVNNHAHVLKPKSMIDVDYLCYSLMFYDTNGLVNGATRQKLTQATMRKMKIPKITLEEQLKIVEKLKKVQGVITKKRKQLEGLDILIKARFVEMFGDPLAGTEKWSFQTVGDVADSVDPQPSHRTPPVVEGGIPYVSMKDCNYKNGTIDFAGARKVSPDVLVEHHNRYELHNGDFIIGKIGTIGNPIFVPKRDDYALSANVVLIQPNSSKVSPYFLKETFESSFVERQFLDAKNSTSQAAFGIKKVRNIKMMNPDMKTQMEFENFAIQVDKLKVEVQSIFLNCDSRSIFRYAQSIKGCKIEKYERRCSFDTKRECHRGNEKKWWICYLSAIKSDC